MPAIIFGLISALSWGGGDFLGGLSSRRIGPFLAVLFAELAGLVVLIAAIPLVKEPLPNISNLLIGAGVGAVACLALVLLYAAMASGLMSIAAPVSALLSAAVPIIVGSVTEGLPGTLQFTGFLFSLLAVWLISQEGSGRPTIKRLADLRLPFLAGLGFGLYFVLIHRITQSATLWPMIASRTGGTLVMLIVVLLKRTPVRIPTASVAIVCFSGILDIGGNLFYILSGQVGRLDVAAVLSSLYPGGTVFLAWIILKEHLSRMQVTGILSALVAIVLMTL